MKHKIVIQVELTKGSLYAYIMTQKPKLDQMATWKKNYFEHFLVTDRRSRIEPAVPKLQMQPSGPKKQKSKS